MSFDTKTTPKMRANAGIAIGPILFVVAILAILAAAIAAGSGHFSGNDSSNRAKAAATVEVGNNLRLGMERLIARSGAPSEEADFNLVKEDLFSPSIGGLTEPSINMSNRPAFDRWAYLQGSISGFGTARKEILAVLPVSRGVCAEINKLSVGIFGIPPLISGSGLGTFMENDTEQLNGSFPDASEASNWTSGFSSTPGPGVSLIGVRTGCVFNGGAILGANCPSADCYLGWSVEQGSLLPKVPSLISPAYALTAPWEGGSCTDECQAGPSSPFFFYQVLLTN